MGATKHDYLKLERQYVEGTMSIRELCRDNGINSWSTVNAYANKHVWNEKRQKFQDDLREKESSAIARKLAEGRADQIAQALDDGIKVANKAMFTFLDSLEDRWVKHPKTGDLIFIPAQLIEAGDFVKIFDKVIVLNGLATKREAHVGLNVSGEFSPENTPVELLRDVIALARERGVESGPSGGASPLPRSERARKVN
jgi:hypothetical protein